jgi:guanine deaminase
MGCEKMNIFMESAVEEALNGVSENEGGPFGAVIVRNNTIIVRAHNEVLKTNDPTAHAEIVAIRKASKLLGRFDLSDCEIYTTCEPCPMCFAAIHWAKIKKLYYGATREDAANAGFDDQFIYNVILGTAEKNQVDLVQIDRIETLYPLKEWIEKSNKVQY